MADLPKELSQIDLDGFVNALARIGEEVNRSRIREEAISSALEAARNINLNDPSSVFSEPVVKNLLKVQTMPGRDAAVVANQLEGLIKLATKTQELGYGQQIVSPLTGERIGERMPDKPQGIVPRLESITDEQAERLGIQPAKVERLTGPGGAVREIRHYPKVYFNALTGEVIRDPVTQQPKVSVEHLQSYLPNVPTGMVYEPLPDSDVDKLAKMIGENRALPRAVFALRDPDLKRVMVRVADLYPGYDLTAFSRRLETAKDFSTKGKSGQNVVRLNQGIGHLGSMYEAGVELRNSPVQFWNEIKNYGLAKFSGDPRVDKFMVAAEAVAGELASIFKGTSGTDQEIKAWRQRINDVKSPEQLDAITKQAVELIGSRIAAMRDAYIKQFGAPPAEPLLAEKSVEVLKKFGVDPESVESGKVGRNYYNPSELPVIEKALFGRSTAQSKESAVKPGIDLDNMEFTPEKELIKDGKVFIKVGNKVFKLDPNLWEKVDGKWRRKRNK